MYGKVAVSCSASLRTVIIDTDTALICRIRSVIDIGPFDTDCPDTGAIAQ